MYARCGSRTPLVLPPPRVPALNPAPTSRRVCHLALQSASATSWPADRKTTRGAAATEATLIYRTRERPDVLAKASATAPATPAEFVVKAGTKIPLSLVNSLNAKVTAEGDRVYLETAFPIVQDGRIVVPKGSYVAGTVTEVKRAGKLKGKAELFPRFDSLTLPTASRASFVPGRTVPTATMWTASEGKIRGRVGGRAAHARRYHPPQTCPAIITR